MQSNYSETDTASQEEWNLSDLYSSHEDLFRDLKHFQKEADQFRLDHKEKSLEQAIAHYENLLEGIDRIASYVYLLRSKDLRDFEIGKFYQEVTEKQIEISKSLAFFPLYVNETKEDAGKYNRWVELSKRFKPHQLSEDLETFSLDKHLTGKMAWTRFYEEKLAQLTFMWKEKAVSISEMLDLISHEDPLIRQEAARVLGEGFEKEKHTFTFIYNTLLQDKRVEDRIRHYASPESERHLHNQIDENDVKALVSTVKERYKTLSHRYYPLKAKLLGLDPFYYWDRNAPLKDNKNISWEEAKTIVINAYEAFSPKMAEIGRQFFEKGWIDAKPSSAKTSGAFAHPTVPSAHPYILMTYSGKLRDVMTLAHELGHGIHQVLAAKQGHLLSETPLTLAETASVFGEMLTFKWLIKNYKDDKKTLLVSKLDDMMNTVVRQIAFHLFEEHVHAKKRELSTEELNEIWLITQKEALGEAVTLDPCVQHYWSYISHFFEVPFYVYAYAFADCLVNTLYQKYEETPEGFADRFITLLQDGGVKSYQEALKPFGLDPSHSHFWHKGLDVIEKMIDELENTPN